MPLRLGKLAPKSHPNTLSFSKYLLHSRKALPVPPATEVWDAAVKTWNMLKNDEVGDCVFAAAGHMIMNWTANQGDEIIPTDDDIIQAYSAVTGYIPGNEATDNGAAITDMLAYWQSVGIAGHKIDGWVAVDWTNLEHVKLGIYLFGAINPGINLPQSAMDQFNADMPWDVVSDDGGILGGHSVPYLSYGGLGDTGITWARRQPTTWAFWQKYTDEAYCPLSLDWIDAKGVAPNHINLNSLRADLQALKS